MAKGKQALGKGLDVLFSDSKTEGKTITPAETEPKKDTDSVLFVHINKIKTNPYQPREDFEEISLQELADSIKQKGVIQAITIRKTGTDSFELLSGERRLRAAKIAGLDKIPAFVLDVNSKEDLLEISLIENIQRKDLNPLEVAKGYQRLIAECRLKQEQVAEKVGKSRAAVTNFLRLLKLPDEIKQSISKGEITEGHARAILALNDETGQINLWRRIIGENLTVRRAEEITKKLKSKPKEKKIFSITSQDKAEIDFLEGKFREHFGTKVKIKPKTSTSGDIVIEYYTAEDLERIVELCRKK
jgi:ParB family transcriptional regulator, chromosome partitioning protein